MTKLVNLVRPDRMYMGEKDYQQVTVCRALARDLNLDVTLKLPNIERRLRVFVTSDDVAESPDVAGERRNFRAGLRFNPWDEFDFDVGVRADLPPVAFASLRWSRFVPLGRWDIYPFAKLFAETDEGPGVSAGITFDRRIGAATIYRTLRVFQESGIVAERHFEGGATRFELVGDEHHDHLICTSCGTIIEFEDDAIERHQQRVASQHGFELHMHRHELYGVCATCRRAARQ